MSIRSLESTIAAHARRVFNNPDLRIKDLMEWSSGQIKPQEGEVVEQLTLLGVFVAVKVECDKRPDRPPEADFAHEGAPR